MSKQRPRLASGAPLARPRARLPADALARSVTPALLHRRAETTLSLLMLLRFQLIKQAARSAGHAPGQPVSDPRQPHVGHHAKRPIPSQPIAQRQRATHGRHGIPAHSQAQAGARAARPRLKRPP